VTDSGGDPVEDIELVELDVKQAEEVKENEGLEDPVMHLEDVGDSDEDAAGELEGDTDALRETEGV
jgi:hypothetical protein